MTRRFIHTLALGAVCCSAALAQGTTEAAPKDFATVKAQITARLQQELACVESATTQDMLMACRPHPPGGHPPGPPQPEK